MLSFVLLWCLLLGLALARGAVEDISIKDAPYQVLIVKKSNNSHVLGSAVILNEKWVVTPASTIKGHWHKPRSLMIRSGSGSFNKHGGLHNVKKIAVHPDFDRRKPDISTQGDIALIQLVGKFHLSMTVAPVGIAPQVTPPDVSSHLVTWPIVQQGAERSNSLKAVSVKTQDWVKCVKNITDSAGVTLGIETFCTEMPPVQGQSGDPLISEGRLIGLFKSLPIKSKKDIPQVSLKIGSVVLYKTIMRPGKCLFI
ncbi:Trypsin-5 [Nesidiocoris tenuis]|uniref:Trypsin-5 n=1 Tax=Nesidiocoris tenuis TaxID=355587 RepID=A0ABN7AGV6_9HEMI|nr:Trypsin-5 [Nesidiocoris tenuis]